MVGTPPVLMTKAVWEGFCAVCPADKILTEGWVKQVNIAAPRRTKSVDWTNILKRPFRSTLTRTDPNGTESTFPRFVRFNETTVSAGVRFRF